MGSLQLKSTLAVERDAAVAKAHEFLNNAKNENRELEAAERAEVEKHLAKARELKARIDALQGDDDMRSALSAFQKQEDQVQAAITDGQERGRRRILSLGEQFVGSQAYKETIRGAQKTPGWRSASAELFLPGMQATTLTEDSGSAGDLVIPQYITGIKPLLFERLTVADLLSQGQTDGNAITYMVETTATNAAAIVAEGADKPDATLVFDAITETLKKIAVMLPVSDEMLEDVSQIRSYIDSRLRLFVQITEEAQLLNGSGSGGNITGLRNRSGMRTDIVRDTPDLTPDENNMDAIHRMITSIIVNAFLMPDGIVMHPTNWQTIALAKDANGQYLAAGPFNASQQYRLWGLPVVSTTAITANTALVGAYKTGAQVFRRGGITVDSSNSHSDFFKKNLTAIRAEERLALAVYRPGAFGEVTGLA